MTFHSCNKKDMMYVREGKCLLNAAVAGHTHFDKETYTGLQFIVLSKPCVSPSNTRPLHSILGAG